MKYADKLKDPRWQKRRLEIMKRDDFRCLECRAHDKPLNVHHRLYFSEPWEAPDWALQTLCEECHELIPKGITTIPVEEIHRRKLLREQLKEIEFNDGNQAVRT